MAIETVNARYEGFIFDGENSRDYGVYVTDVEVFGAPSRNVEMVQIPGRDGAFALDKGSWENIEVKYHCAMGCKTQADFNAGISAVRNMLASRIGYKRLEDEINTDEYRMACFHGGISVPTLNKDTATFDVVFDCKPQRYLKSGETAVAVTSGGTVTNNTAYEARPILELFGSGSVTLNGAEFELMNKPIGAVQLMLGNGGYRASDTGTVESTRAMDNIDAMNTGDTVAVDGGIVFYVEARMPRLTYRSAVTLVQDGGLSVTPPSTGTGTGQNPLYLRFTTNAFTFNFGVDYSANCVYRVTLATGVKVDVELRVSVVGDTLTTSTTATWTGGESLLPEMSRVYAPTKMQMVGDSTQNSLGNPAYVDLDIGEAYKYENGQLVSVNSALTVPDRLPVLVPGENTVTFDSTYTSVKIIPRWWQL